MKTYILPLIALLLLASCSSVRVASDYDTTVNFNQYQTYAYFKPGIDKAEISDLDKRRILRAIDREMSTKGMQKSETPDVMISFFTKAKERVDVYQNHYGWGHPWGWGWGHPWGGTSVSRSTEGTLYIDVIDAKTNELVWQGIGTAPLNNTSMERKEARINEIVKKILERFPPK